MDRSLLLLLFGAVICCAVAEYIWRKRTGRGYDLGALGGTLGTAVGQGVTRALTYGLMFGGLLAAYTLAPFKWSLDQWQTWVVGFFVLEFFYYWQHRFSHTIRWFWTSHAVHHSTNEFTLPAATRLGWTSTLTGAWLVFVPMALMGFHPVLISTLMLANLRYQYFIHTDAIGKLGPLEWVFNTPSHHRVHHGSNPEYLDKNFGGFLIVFDRLFGSFAEERENNPAVYGLTKPVLSNNPFVIALHEWGNLFADLRRAQSFNAIIRALFGRPADSLGVEDTPSEAREVDLLSTSTGHALPPRTRS
ncbi:MAG: sterol desaturase family protein [Maricaulis sp.]|jgi:sterol desaturase/sphingolipid hydroxylase (fatty acid hydroxylase superfamily)|uniref:sterol desaturase family protein n=1 Tax=Pseudomonadota TaxID=1224 RepID=UPI001B1EB612|nr:MULTISPECIES: sterol desaturase family protein [Pseudomonadota]MBO6730579.1 sterol desaturase family protein [Maricaulis sp.]MBO6813188.1 sterol desaturase family protein [Marinobacter sp.]MBO6878764.1 sterol desaturase family protein [Maricaulis sp.]